MVTGFLTYSLSFPCNLLFATSLPDVVSKKAILPKMKRWNWRVMKEEVKKKKKGMDSNHCEGKLIDSNSFLERKWKKHLTTAASDLIHVLLCGLPLRTELVDDWKSGLNTKDRLLWHILSSKQDPAEENSDSGCQTAIAYCCPSESERETKQFESNLTFSAYQLTAHSQADYIADFNCPPGLVHRILANRWLSF